MKHIFTFLLLVACAANPSCAAHATADSFFAFDAGGDFRMRQEIMHNVPSTPNGGMVGAPGVIRGKTKNQMRFRPRIWAELKMGESWRIYSRLVDEMRAGLVKPTHAHTWPGEVVVDNLFIEGKNLFDDKIDLLIGRRDIRNLYGLSHIFSDGTPGDGSRSCHADMVTLALHVDEDSWLDMFAIFNKDREYMRFGTERSRIGTQNTGFGGNDTEMDDWGFGTVWNSRVDLLKYQIFAIQKNTAAFHRKGVKHPDRQVNMLGIKLEPQFTDNFSTPLEAMVQFGENGRGDSLKAWAAYAGFDWKDKTKSTWRPFWNGGLLALSGDRGAANEDGGHTAWDPMWYRAVDDSEMFVYGISTYGVNWWSNMYNLKTTLGIDIAKNHRVSLMTGPMFAQAADGIGGGNGYFKGYLTSARYDFPLWENGRFEVFGHLFFEHFLPGDYYETDKPAYFVRWQIDFKF